MHLSRGFVKKYSLFLNIFIFALKYSFSGFYAIMSAILYTVPAPRTRIIPPSSAIPRAIAAALSYEGAYQAPGILSASCSELTPLSFFRAPHKYPQVSPYRLLKAPLQTRQSDPCARICMRFKNRNNFLPFAMSRAVDIAASSSVG